MNPYLIALFVLAALTIRVGLHFLDIKAVRMAAEMKGWKNVGVSWAPFAPGWFFEKGERNYRVTYADQLERWHEVYCKTSLLTGVYWRDEDQRLL